MSTRLYVLDTDARIEVFDDPVGQALIHDETLEAWQAKAAAAAGLELHRVAAAPKTIPKSSGPYFVMDGDVFATPRFLVEFARKARILDANCVAGLASNPVVDRAAAGHPKAEQVGGGWTYGLRYVTKPRAKSYAEALLQMDDLAQSTARLPKALEATGRYTFCESSKAILHVTSPIHVLQANLHANVARHVPVSGMLGLRRAQVAQQSTNNLIGDGCAIHPSAVLEGCQLGARVMIGANVVCRQSVIGDDVILMDGTTVLRSIIGRGSQCSFQHRVVHSVVYPDCYLISGALQFSIMGRASGVFATWVTDTRMDGKCVRTPIDGEVRDSGMHYLGAIVGHRAKVTAGVVTAPGRVVPSGAIVHTAPGNVYTGLPPGHPVDEPYFISQKKKRKRS